MMTQPRRTKVTALTDDELILLDVLFDIDLTFRQLDQEGFGDFHNTHRVHHLSDRALKRTLDRWCQEGILRHYRLEGYCDPNYPDFDPWQYALTPVGGALWEAERTPDWRRYVTMLWDLPDDPGIRTQLVVCSPSKAVGRDFLESICQRDSDDIDYASLRARTRRGLGLLPWKRFSYFVEWSIMASPDDHFSTVPRPRREVVPTWWTDVDDLQQFLPLAANGQRRLLI